MNRSRDGPSPNSVSTIHTHTLSLLTALPESVLWSAIVPLHRLLLPPLQTTWSVSGTCPQKNRLIPRPHSETPFRDPIPRPRPFRDWPSPLLRAGEESSKSWSELSRLSFLTCMTEFSIIDSINMMMWIVVGSYWKFELGNCFWLMNWYMMNCLLKRLQPWSSFWSSKSERDRLRVKGQIIPIPSWSVVRRSITLIPWSVPHNPWDSSYVMRPFLVYLQIPFFQPIWCNFWYQIWLI